MPEFTDILARDRFTGSDTADISSRTPDGGGAVLFAVGNWDKIPGTDYSAGTDQSIGIKDERAVHHGGDAFGIAYALDGIPGITADYGVEVTGRFPITYEGASTVRTLYAATDFPGTAGASLDGRALEGAGLVAEKGEWRRISRSKQGDGGEALLDGDGLVHAGSASGSEAGAFYTIDGFDDLPDNYDVSFKLHHVGSGDAGEIRLPFRIQDTIVALDDEGTGTNGIGAYYLSAQQEADETNLFFGTYGGDTLAGVGRSEWYIPVGESAEILVAIRGSNFYVYRDGVLLFVFSDPQFVGDTTRNWSSGPPGLWFADGGTDYQVSEYRVYTYESTGAVTPTRAYLFAYARYDADDDTGYSCGIQRDDPTLPSSTNNIFAMYAAFQGDYRLLYTEALTIEGGETDWRPAIECEGTEVRAYLNGILKHTWTFGEDDAFGDPVPSSHEIATGLPALFLMDDEDAQRQVVVSEWTCYGEASTPCTGDPTNPYPWEPPPVPPEDQPLVYVMGRGVWRGVPVSDLSAMGLGHFRSAIDLAVQANGGWRFPGDPTIDAPPEPDTPEPPFYDPCQLLPEIPPGDVTPLPLTSRFIGMSAAPLSVCGPVFNGAKIAVGPWTVNDLALCVSKGVTLMSAIGGRAAYQVGGEWDEDQFVAVVLSKLLPMLALLQARTVSGEYFGHSSIDDFESPRLWPPSGVPHASLASAIARIKAALATAAGLPTCPIRIGLRGRPSQFSVDPGADFYGCQFKSWAGQSATAFATTEYTIAASRSAFITLDLNYLHGGNGSSGYQVINGTMLSGHYACSAAEIVSYLTDMFDAALAVDSTAEWLAGSLGYQYNPEYLANVPGVIDAIATARNHLAGFPALP